MRFTSNITPSREIENLVARTKLELMKKHTFFAIILMKAQTIYTDKVQTCATDGKHLLINPEFVDTLTEHRLRCDHQRIRAKRRPHPTR
jgi:predicted metal-dependent peptidase